MKLLVLIVLAVIVGLAAIIAATQLLQPEIRATPQAGAPKENASVPNTTPQIPVMTPAMIEEPQQDAPKNATREACLALEKRLLDDLDAAQMEMRRKEKQFNLAQKEYEDASDAPVQDAQRLQTLRRQRDDAKDAWDDAQLGVNDAENRLFKARAECRLPQ